MRFGLFFLGSSSRRDYRREYEEILEQCVYAEELGYDFVWIAEHHGSDYGVVPSPAILGAAIAERTERVRIGVGVSVLPLLHPLRVAEDYAMLDVLSDGRLDLGVGRGYQPREFDMFEVDQSLSRERFAEALDVVLGLWSGEPFSYHGEFFNFDDVQLFPQPLQQPAPIHIAAVSTPSFKIAAERGLSIMTTPALLPMAALKDAIVGGVREMVALGHAPESVDFSVSMVVHLAPSELEARAAATPAVNFQFERALRQTPGFGKSAPRGYEEYEAAMREMGDGEVPPLEGLAALGNILVGDPEGARALIGELRDDVGLRNFGCLMNTGGMEPELVRRSMKLFAEEVMPAFEDDPPIPRAVLSGVAG
jgi:alkanesulfonate monooxygenase SsuD/methylene tetrahydromethanopterin reductase-like flavin-dependent oxidoreductase (luciferase family)